MNISRFFGYRIWARDVVYDTVVRCCVVGCFVCVHGSMHSHHIWYSMCSRCLASIFECQIFVVVARRGERQSARYTVKETPHTPWNIEMRHTTQN